MHLKGLHLEGFKSFSNKTYIDFNEGITAIVGPNGSGKSNILDAILWVLGEQSYKNIRALNSQDVIFSGGKNKRGSSSATVSLVIENSDRYLDYESDEIKITRRVYKSGEGEYFINDKKSRLKDIQNLFMDTGIGKQAYSIIGQGRVERIIGSNPKEIREILEEAAGTKRARIEKDDANKKLNNVSLELEKILYVEKDLETRVKRLKDESEKASLFKSFNNEIEAKNYAIDEFNLENIKKEQLDLEFKRKEIEEENNKILEKLNELNEDYKKVLEIFNEKEKSLAFNKEKIENINEDIELLKNDLNDKKIEKSNFEIKLSEKLKLKDRLLDDFDIYAKKVEKFKSEINLIEKELLKKENVQKELFDKIEILNKKNTELEEKILEKEKILKNLEFDNLKNNSEVEDYNKKIKSSEINLINLDKEKKEYVLEKEKLEKELEILNEKFVKEESKYNEEIDNDRKTNEKINNLDIKSKEMLNYRLKKVFELEKKKSEIASLNKNIEDYSFANKSVKYILEKYKDDENIIDIVSNIIKIPSEYLVSISGLISFNLNDIVIKGSNKVSKYINDLKEKKIGSVSFLPINSIKISKILDKKPEIEGVIDFARKLVKYDKNLEKIIFHVFANALVVKDINVANKVLNLGYSDRIITLDGDIISARGRISGGFKKNKVDLSLLNKENLNKLKDEFNFLEKELNSLDYKYNSNMEEIEKLRTKLLNKSINIEFNELKSKLSDIKNEISVSNKKINTVEVEKKLTESTLIEHKNKLFDIRKNIEFNNERLEIEFNLKEDLEFEIAKLENSEKYENKLQKLNIEIAVLNEKFTNNKENKDNDESILFRIDKDLKEIKAFEDDKEELFKDFNENINNLSNKIDEKSLEKGNISLNINLLEKEIEENTLKEREISNFKTEIDKNIYKNNNDIEKISEKIGRNEKELELLNERIENLEHKKEEITSHYTYKKISDEKEIPILRKEIITLENKKNNIGSVNLSSIEEYASENERYLKLKTQREDLEKSSLSIKELISNIEKEMKDKFTLALNEIRNNFKYMCKEIFYGAKGDIKLINEEDILNSGLELGVKYKNKPEQTLMLLSGGEKSMLAVSFIMAIFMFKPSPFTFFDEIEAALDEANTKKIIELLRRFIDKSQFILITHNKETMKGADRLYGVTMNKEVGESKIVSVDI